MINKTVTFRTKANTSEFFPSLLRRGIIRDAVTIEGCTKYLIETYNNELELVSPYYIVQIHASANQE